MKNEFKVHYVMHAGHRITGDGRIFKDGVFIGQYRSMNQAMVAAEQLEAANKERGA